MKQENNIQKWVEGQNVFSIESRKIVGHNITYNYYSKKQNITRKIGRYTFGFDGIIPIENVKEKIAPNGIKNDNKPYFWHYFHYSCSFESEVDEVAKDLIQDRYIHKKIKIGQWFFHQNAYLQIARILSGIKMKIGNDKQLIAYLPSNNFIKSDVQKKYFDEIISALRKYHITYVVGNLENVEEREKQLVVFVIDIITTIKRQQYIIENIMNLRAPQHPLVAFYSLMIVYDKKTVDFCVALKKIQSKVEEEKNTKKATVCVPGYDEEDMIMRALSGRGADPELFGF